MRFAEKVYRIVKKIPAGRVSTYKNVAESLGCKAYRAVGNALNKNPYAPIIPCHRIVRSDGMVGGFASGTKNKIKLLNKEGVRIIKCKVLDFEKVFYKLR
ncbi:MAG: MGMT family protein [Nanoarchaeota archaeon]|nr:MGMT family protein [Nanoarchaeota archaeon]